MSSPASIQRAFVSVFSDDLPGTRDFYMGLLGYQPEFESDWFIHLQSAGDANLELGIIRRDHEIVPEGFAAAAAGTMLTVVVEKVDEVYAEAQAKGYEILEAPRDLFYGQRRMVLKDPNGLLVDVSSECAPSPEFIASLS